jgi:hypothetical protein
MKLCWFVPDDRGGGIVSVAVSCVRQARDAGHDAVLLLSLQPTGWLDGVPGLRARDAFSEETMWRAYARFLDQVTLRPPPSRPLAGQPPPDFVPIRRRFQLLPASVRKTVRDFIGRSPWLGYLLRDLRGF